MKEILSKLNISLEDGPWDFEKRGRPYALNQIIINTNLIDKEGNTKCRLEFTFPVNGAYDNPEGGKWEY